jgi:hypothetical protein
MVSSSFAPKLAFLVHFYYFTNYLPHVKWSTMSVIQSKAKKKNVLAYSTKICIRIGKIFVFS